MGFGPAIDFEWINEWSSRSLIVKRRRTHSIATGQTKSKAANASSRNRAGMREFGGRKPREYV